ncbi:uncharacterized protein LOC116424287 [Nomia melanderi]|uniref:uncharacterized protein LOC116424287 n=1 Tax=Nomia melanderi TaxID=2448451 RepID=UPI00130433ED|nr:protein TSSC4 [Nomia melanderi]
MHTPGDFIVHGGDRAFANRQKLLFDKLSDAEQKCHKNKIASELTDENMVIDEISDSQIIRYGIKQHYETRRFRGKESIFKRPEGPAPRAANRSIPDYHRNPHKWKKYSLDDVSNDDMTDQSNTRAALSFLKELRARRLTEQRKDAEKMDVTEKEQTEIIFKPKKIKPTLEIKFKKPGNNVGKTLNEPIIVDHDDKPVFRSSKIIMPEYVIGQKHKKKIKKDKPVQKVDCLKQLKLDHLEELDEEQD